MKNFSHHNQYFHQTGRQKQQNNNNFPAKALHHNRTTTKDLLRNCKNVKQKKNPKKKIFHFSRKTHNKTCVCFFLNPVFFFHSFAGCNNNKKIVLYFSFSQ
jgi:hypothetical protein